MVNVLIIIHVACFLIATVSYVCFFFVEYIVQNYSSIVLMNQPAIRQLQKNQDREFGAVLIVHHSIKHWL